MTYNHIIYINSAYSIANDYFDPLLFFTKSQWLLKPSLVIKQHRLVSLIAMQMKVCDTH